MPRFFKSVTNALKGMKHIFHTQSNFRIQITAAFSIIIAGFLFQIKAVEWFMLGTVILSVLVLEIINTAFEKVLDVLKPRFDERVGMVKDIMAAAVLLVSAAAVIVGLCIFLPHFIELISQ